MTRVANTCSFCRYLTITVEILHSIVKECPTELGLYGSRALSVLDIVLESNDIKVVEAAAQAFEAICAQKTQNLLAGDQNYFRKYASILRRFSQFASRSRVGHTTGTNVWLGQQYRTIGLRALRSVVKTETVRVEQEYQLREIVPAILENLCPGDAAGFGRLVRLEHDREMQRRHSLNIRRSVNINRDSESRDRDVEAASQTAEMADRLREEDVGISAVTCLRQLFEPGVSSRSQLRETVLAMESFITRMIVPIGFERIGSWADTLFQTVCSWAAVQDRFVILVRAINLMESEREMNKSIILAGVVAAMLNSDTTYVGLGVVDAMRMVLNVLVHSQNMSMDENHALLVEKIRQCLIGFGHNVYYRGQITDLVGALIGKVRDENDLSADSKVVVLDAVQSLLGRLDEDASAPLSSPRMAAVSPVQDDKGRRPTSSHVLAEQVPISVWEGTERLLAEDDWPIRRAWVGAWVKWVDRHASLPGARRRQLSLSSDVNMSSAMAPVSASNTVSMFNESGSSSGSTSRPRTVLDSIALAAYDLAHAARSSDDHTRLVHTLLASFPRLGESGIVSFMPMVVTLQENIKSVKDLNEKIRVGAMSLGYFWAVSEEFGLSETAPGRTIMSEVGRRQHGGLWVRGVGMPAGAGDYRDDSYPSATDGSADDKLLRKIRKDSLCPFDDQKDLVSALSHMSPMSPASQTACLSDWSRTQALRELHLASGSRAPSMNSRVSARRAVSGVNPIITTVPTGTFDGASPSGGLFPTTTVGMLSRKMDSSTRLSGLAATGLAAGLLPGMAGVLTASGATTPNRSSSSRLSLANGGTGGGGLRFEELRQTLMGGGGPSSTESLVRDQYIPFADPMAGVMGTDDAPPVPPIPAELAASHRASPVMGRKSTPAWSSVVQGLLQDTVGWGLDGEDGSDVGAGPLVPGLADIDTAVSDSSASGGGGGNGGARPKSDMGPDSGVASRFEDNISSAGSGRDRLGFVRSGRADARPASSLGVMGGLAVPPY